MPVYLVAVTPAYLESHKKKISFSKNPTKDALEQIRHNFHVVTNSFLLLISGMNTQSSYQAPTFTGDSKPDVEFMGMGVQHLKSFSNSVGYTGDENNMLNAVIDPSCINQTVPYQPGETPVKITPRKSSSALQLAKAERFLVTPTMITVYVDSNTTPNEAALSGISQGVLFESILDAKNYAKYKDHFIAKDLEKFSEMIVSIEDTLKSIQETIDSDIPSELTEVEPEEIPEEGEQFSTDAGKDMSDYSSSPEHKAPHSSFFRAEPKGKETKGLEPEPTPEEQTP